MNINDSAQIIDALKDVNDAVEVYEVRHYEVWRKHPGGGTLPTQVTIMDRGPGENQRYSVSASNEEGKSTGPNFDDDLLKAIRFCHWYELDK